MMCRLRYFAAVVLLILVGCASAAPQIVIVPTLAILPSETPSPTETATSSPTFTPRPTATQTPNLLETEVAVLNATNAAIQATMEALLTRSAPSATPAMSFTPSMTITSTLPPSEMSPQVVPVLAQAVYVTSTANLRDCASRECAQALQVQPGNALLVTGTIEGEAINAGNPLWYRVDYLGQTLFVYSDLVSATPPTSLPPTAVPVFVAPPVEVAPPVSVPQGGGSCPSMSATCGQLTCEQAYACLAAGNGRLDADDDGIPCESVCLGN